jgi:predicted RNase H-like HicB family nuclease
MKLAWLSPIALLFPDVLQGATETEALENIREAIAGCLEARRANNMPLTVAVHEIEVGV